MGFRKVVATLGENKTGWTYTLEYRTVGKKGKGRGQEGVCTGHGRVTFRKRKGHEDGTHEKRHTTVPGERVT